VSNKDEALAICSEFTDDYGVDINDGETIVVYTKSEYLNELRKLLERKKYKIFSYQIYDGEALINFIPSDIKKID
jgi:hypothetical protein